MTFVPDDKDAERTLLQQNDEIITLLKALLLGIEIITDQNLREQVEE